jgi:hypothetical protein
MSNNGKASASSRQACQFFTIKEKPDVMSGVGSLSISSVSLARLVLRLIELSYRNLSSPIPRKFTDERPQCPRRTQYLLHDDRTGPILPCPLHRGSLFCLLLPHPGLHRPGSRHRHNLCSPLIWLFLRGNRTFICVRKRAFLIRFGHTRSGEETPLITSRQPSHQSGQ